MSRARTRHYDVQTRSVHPLAKPNEWIYAGTITTGGMMLAKATARRKWKHWIAGGVRIREQGPNKRDWEILT